MFETLLETWKLDVRSNWFIVDYNRQSLDKIMEDQSARVIDRMFRLNGWEVLTLKFGKQMRAAFELPGRPRPPPVDQRLSTTQSMRRSPSPAATRGARAAPQRRRGVAAGRPQADAER